ncbi:MAG: hypothetical protein ACTSXJ_10460 [Candidatus Baldrarchaeia archaeon]
MSGEKGINATGAITGQVSSEITAGTTEEDRKRRKSRVYVANLLSAEVLLALGTIASSGSCGGGAPSAVIDFGI